MILGKSMEDTLKKSENPKFTVQVILTIQLISRKS